MGEATAGIIAGVGVAVIGLGIVKDTEDSH